MSAETELEIVGVDRIDGDQVIVEFSDGTEVTLTIEDVLKVASDRIRARGPSKVNQT